MVIYKASVVHSLQEYYGSTLFPDADLSIHDHLYEIALKMMKGLESNVECIYSQINNYHNDFLGISIDILKQKQFQLADCQHSIANEYGFNSWDDVEGLGTLKYDQNFEECVQAVVNGDLDKVLKLLQNDPSLIRSQSNYGHSATLLHYTSSNGVEIWRQQVPKNLDQVIKLLLDNGADKGAKMKVYGGLHTAYDLFITSAHPYDCGLDPTVEELLKF